MKHTLKIWPQYYSRVADGSKTFEVRNNDRGFQPGDEVVLREWNPEQLQDMDDMQTWAGCRAEYGDYTNSPDLKFKVGYVLPIDDKRVVFSLLKIGEL